MIFKILVMMNTSTVSYSRHFPHYFCSLVTYREFLSAIESQLWTCYRLLESTDATLNLLSSLKTSFEAVHNQTAPFQSQCEELVSEEERLETLSGQISRGLAPFAEFESIATKLNRPGTEFVKTRSFADMLKTLDWCLADLAKYVSFCKIICLLWRC